MAGLKPLIITARLQQGVSWDPRYGIALDGLLNSLIRASEAFKEGILAGSLLDGGLDLENPKEWDLPLAKCENTENDDWHWLATVGQPLGLGDSELVSSPLDAHRLMVKLDERRAESIAVALPKNVGGPRGRYRTRVTPVLVTVSSSIQWHAIGDLEKISNILSPVLTIGARRGSGEGKVESWHVQESEVLDYKRFGHTHPNGKLGRAVPESCALALGLDVSHKGYAGLRPPMFHKTRQKLLVLPDME